MVVRLPCGGRITVRSDPHGAVRRCAVLFPQNGSLSGSEEYIENGNKVYDRSTEPGRVFSPDRHPSSQKKKSLKHGVAIGSLLLNRQLGGSSSAYAYCRNFLLD